MMNYIRPFRLFENGREIFSFDELSPIAQKNALDINRNINVYFDGWEEGVTQDFREEMKNIGIDDITISFSGFYSQGDGASFTSNDIDTRKFFNAVGIKSSKALNMEGEDERSKGENKDFYDLLDTMEDIGQLDKNRIVPEDIKVFIERTDSRYVHYNSIKANVEIYDERDDWEERWGLGDDLEEKVTEYIRLICKDLYRKLEKEYEFLTSDENVRETLVDNDREFDEKGNIV